MTVINNVTCNNFSVSGFVEEVVIFFEEGYDDLKDKAKEGINGAIDKLPGSIADVVEGGVRDFDMDNVMADVQQEMVDRINDANPKLGPGPLEGSSQFATAGYSGGNAIENLAVDAAAGAVLGGAADAAEDAINSLIPKDMPVRAAIDFQGLTTGGEAVVRAGIEATFANCTEEDFKQFRLGVYNEYVTGFWNDSPSGRRYAQDSYDLISNKNGTVKMSVNANLSQYDGRQSSGGSVVVSLTY